MSGEVPADLPRIEVRLDCGNCGALIQTTIVLEGDLEAHMAHPREFAATCDCGKTNWVTLTPVRFDQDGGGA